MWRQTSVHNALSHLDPYFDRKLYDRSQAEVLERTGDLERAEAAAWAAVIGAAVRDEADPARMPARDDGGRLPDRVPGPAALVRVADALAAPEPAAASVTTTAGTA